MRLMGFWHTQMSVKNSLTSWPEVNLILITMWWILTVKALVSGDHKFRSSRTRCQESIDYLNDIRSRVKDVDGFWPYTLVNFTILLGPYDLVEIIVINIPTDVSSYVQDRLYFDFRSTSSILSDRRRTKTRCSWSATIRDTFRLSYSFNSFSIFILIARVALQTKPLLHQYCSYQKIPITERYATRTEGWLNHPTNERLWGCRWLGSRGRVHIASSHWSY